MGVSITVVLAVTRAAAGVIVLAVVMKRALGGECRIVITVAVKTILLQTLNRLYLFLFITHLMFSKGHCLPATPFLSDLQCPPP